MSVCSSSRIRAWWYESHVATCNVVYDSKVPELPRPWVSLQTYKGASPRLLSRAITA